MGKYDHKKYDQFNDKDDNHSTEKSIILASGVAIAGIIMAMVVVVLKDNNWMIGILAVALCVLIVLLCSHLIKKKYIAVKWEKGLNILFILGIVILVILVIAYICHSISAAHNKNLDTATGAEQFPASDIPIVIDMSFHSIHERYSDSILNESESRTVIPMSKDSFMRYLRAAAQGEIRGAYYQRYKGDGEQQLLAIVEDVTEYEKSDEGNLYGTIWYVDKYGVKEFDNEAKEYIWPYQFFLDDSNGNVYLAYKQCRQEGNIVYVLGVNETGPYHPIISGQGSDLYINEHGEIEITTLEEISGLGENEIYYFCVEGSFKEYGGIEITLGELSNIQDKNIQDTISLLYGNECQINSIFYRENGIININFSKEQEGEGIGHYNITFRHDGEQVQIVPTKMGQEYGEGTYLEALIPSIATYPDEFPY